MTASAEARARTPAVAYPVVLADPGLPWRSAAPLDVVVGWVGGDPPLNFVRLVLDRGEWPDEPEVSW
ncbi:hypothetical protein OG559_19510 [Micromonospora sp. NBC_01405]|uniref:hypothetical protein n=1 Tax=Micromonospora sp. NBC_01405 TaxID=2903589 RepID=UPI00324BAF75